METARDLGFRMPAEWEPHRGTWLTWPRRDGISFPNSYDAVPPVYAEFIRILVENEDVCINVWDDAMEQEVRRSLESARVPRQRVFFHQFRSYEPWCRDHGPVFVVRTEGDRREKAVVDWGYNAWGGKYPPYDLDDEVPRHVARLRGARLFSPGIVMEGGSIDVNGCGALLTTESCLLNPNRNPSLRKEEIEAFLRDYLGVYHFLWLGDGITGDDTDGHVDDLARFVSPDTIATVVETDPADENFSILSDNLERLKQFRDSGGNPYRIVELPMPGRLERGGQRLPASYANFYIANGVVVAPTFRDRNDARALELLRSCFPGRRVVGLDSTDLIWGLGSFHCISQQEPA